MAKKKKATSKSEGEKDYKEEIKEMERKKREAAHKAASVKPMPSNEREVSFDEWYAMRSASIPKVHRKEVLRADFKSRGCGSKADLTRYDKALEQYGVKPRK